MNKNQGGILQVLSFRKQLLFFFLNCRKKFLSDPYVAALYMVMGPQRSIKYSSFLKELVV